MASIASPRVVPASGASTPTVSSRRTSLDTNRTISPSRPSTTNASAPAARRNRAALRDYYNLKPSAATAAPDTASPAASVASEDVSVSAADSELDKPSFDAEAYVAGVLEKEGLAGVLKAEGALLNEIRELDGERKALVYDNYSKLIAATDTIKGMRANMEPLGASTGDVKGMVERIAGTARELAESAGAKKEEAGGQDATMGVGVNEAEKRKRMTVKWVVDGPGRLKRLVDEGKREEAETQWATISKLLDKWKGVTGVEETRMKCAEVMTSVSKHEHDSDDEDAESSEEEG